MSEELCHCGLPLHYSSQRTRALAEKVIEAAGDPYVTVRVGKRKWRVQRHYIALHGLKAAELPNLGFQELE